MKKIIFATLSASTIAFLLTACAPSQRMQEAQKRDAEFAQSVKNINIETADVGTKPDNFQNLIESAIRENLKDPDSAKFSGFTEPRREVMVENRNFVYGYSSCVFVNAKNSYGGYTGKQLFWAFIRNGKVLRIKNTNHAYGTMIFIGRPVNCS
ncbi:hypothetical protein [Pectobacterium brasiliense]|uniref:hypothetical protein n=1 Tax=Pectobacterium brasiliense TaxID=180957 RepID=UPI0025A015EE|nr:hypothetical protein [Pectobacterium brasiliense]WJM80441.1 hypothetical protein QTI90_19530 [Pectobacterium brasiliense]